MTAWRTRSLSTAVVLVGLALLPASTASAADSEQTLSYDVTLNLRPDGSMHVTEAITYDFGTGHDRHGIEREIPLAFGYDSEQDRVYPISNWRASTTSPDTSADLDKSGVTTVTLRVGDPDETVTGVRDYRLDYDLAGVVNATGGGEELYWNALGHEWRVPVLRASVTVTGPAAVARAACHQGPVGSTTACPQQLTGGSATFTSAGVLQPGDGITVVAGFPAGTFTRTAPILQEKWKIDKAFAVNPGTGAASLGLVAVLAGGTALLVGRRGRDRRYLNQVPGLMPVTGEEQLTRRVGLRRDPIAVQFTPPSQLRVGELGTLIDEQANVVDVTATIIDLAVRGQLRIEEVAPASEEDGENDEDGPSDWTLVRTGQDAADLRVYERTLLDSIFRDRTEVTLSDLRMTFSSTLAQAQRELYQEVTERGWFTANPRSVRIRWRVLGIVLTVIGVVTTVMLAVTTHWALIGVAVLVSGLVVLVLAGRMPARTAAGTALLAQARGFRLYLETAEADQIRFEEGQDVFSRYLPYAIVFGVAERWAGLFAELAAAGTVVAAPTWYVGQYYGYGAFDYGRFGGTMTSFSSETSATIQAGTPSSSGSSGFSGGFSGGGGGGGGGGSW